MINIENERLISVKEARNELPGRPSINTIYRWFWKGAYGIRLESIRVGGRLYTSKEACSRFIYASSQLPTEEARRAKNDAIDLARQFLDASGV